MKKLNITWDGIEDPTGYLFSFAKSLSCAVINSPWPEYARDIIATSGFAFRMWVAADLCASATSIWSFDEQKPWVENGGLICSYVGRYWEQDDIEEQKRLEAITIIRESIDNGIPAVAWDIRVPEWGLITGYDDETQTFSTLAVNGEGEMAYSVLGKREIPILSVLTISGRSDRTQDEILRDTKKLAVNHLKGEEWSENAKGLDAYPALIKHFETENIEYALCWNMEYMLGTYAGLKYYAWKYFEKAGETQFAGVYRDIYEAWFEAFEIKAKQDITLPEMRAKIASFLKSAHENETQAMEMMKGERG